MEIFVSEKRNNQEEGKQIMELDENEKKLAEIYKKVTNHGNAYDQFRLGQMYLEGIGVEKNEKKAAELFQKAANQGDAKAQFELGQMYEEGRGVEKNEKKAAEIYQKAANQGDVKAQFKLGQMYEEGRGVEKNETKAIEAYVNLTNKPHFNTFRMYEKCLERLEKVLQKESEAGDWTQLVTDAFAQMQLSRMYLEGRGVKEDKKKAIELYERAANQGNKEAQFKLGQMYLEGIVVGKK